MTTQQMSLQQGVSVVICNRMQFKIANLVMNLNVFCN